MKQKFTHGDLVKIRATGELVMVIEYKVNRAGSIVNWATKSNDHPEEVVTDEVLCEGKIDGKFQRKYIKEANLELVSAYQQA